MLGEREREHAHEIALRKYRTLGEAWKGMGELSSSEHELLYLLGLIRSLIKYKFTKPLDGGE